MTSSGVIFTKHPLLHTLTQHTPSARSVPSRGPPWAERGTEQRENASRLSSRFALMPLIWGWPQSARAFPKRKGEKKNLTSSSKSLIWLQTIRTWCLFPGIWEMCPNRDVSRATLRQAQGACPETFCSRPLPNQWPTMRVPASVK